MALNKNALIRYRTIDKCLQNRQRRWTLNDLITACSEALYEYEGKEMKVSKRTVQLDIQMMRSDKLGYNAPIEVYDRKYYRYEEEDFSITDIPLTGIDMDVLTESVEMLKQFKDFSLFNELNGVIQKLEDKVYREKNQQSPIIHIDKNEYLKGLEHLDTLYQAILKQVVLSIRYQSFSAREPQDFFFHACILKEFNNRWFVVGKRDEETRIMTLALDRIISITPAFAETYRKEAFDADAFYRNTFGVTVLSDKQLKKVVLWVDPHNAPYVLTKPFHHSQKLLERYQDHSIRIELYLHLNLELERLILGFGDAIEVLEPPRLRKRVQSRLRRAYENYGMDSPNTEGVQ
ncbi:MAG: WYL domain-containing protein [Saprospiraceae bacterium]|nr:WYL domain-containing protein [Saprospiraceae bacterium]